MSENEQVVSVPVIDESNCKAEVKELIPLLNGLSNEDLHYIRLIAFELKENEHE